MSHNYVREWREFEHLSELPCLEDLVFIGNPLEEESPTAQKYIDEVIKRLLILKKLDGYPVIREVDNDDEEEVSSVLDMAEIDRLARYESHATLLSFFSCVRLNKFGARQFLLWLQQRFAPYHVWSWAEYPV